MKEAIEREKSKTYFYGLKQREGVNAETRTAQENQISHRKMREKAYM